MKKLMLIILLLIPLMADADQVYMQTDQNGNVTYSDMPADNARPVNLPQVSTAPAPQPKQAPAAAPAPTTTPVPVPVGNKPYTEFDLVSPVDQETIQNQPSIPVEVKVEPELQPGDKVQIMLDGAPWGPPAPSIHFVFNAPERGTHTMSAELINGSQQVIKETNTVTVYIHQAHNGGAP
jgi:hypothetical protein